MPEVQAFRGIRYDLGHVGSLSDVVAPPYDVIGPDLHDALYRQHPCNIVRIDFNRIEPADDDAANNRYTRAARFYREWRSSGVLFTEADPAIYVYHQEFRAGGQTHVRRGFMARMRLSRFGEGLVFPHEETMPGPKTDRLMLTAVTQANLSPVFGLYPDPANEAQAILDRAVADKTPLAAEDHLGVVHRLWPVSDVGVIAAVSGVMGPKPLFIADGHHRYETACNFRDQVYDSGFLSPTHPANYTLMMCVAMDDPGLIIMPTHRLFRGLPTLDSRQLAERLSPSFTVEPAGEGADRAVALWDEIEVEGAQGTLALFAQADQRWLIARLAEAGRQRMQAAAPDHSSHWQELGVALLHRLLVEDLLGATKLPKPTYVHLVEEVVAELKTGAYPLAALVMPATVQHVREISLGGERMPAKSTYFYPKLLTGLVINPLE
jgi:uncharacterized protein (DUF1015 family)